MKEKKVARVIYNADADQFELHIMTAHGWAFEAGYKCVASKNGDGQHLFIHWGIIDKVSILQDRGYNIKFLPAVGETLMEGVL